MSKEVENVIKKLHFVGKKKFYIEGDEKTELERKIDKEIDKEITRQALSLNNFDIELPKLTEAEYNEIRLEVIKEMLKAKGVSEEKLNELFEETEKAALKAMEDHEEHVKNDFKVVK